MLKPITRYDDLFPWIVEDVNGKEVAVAKKADWTVEKDIDLAIRTIEYLLQFPKYHGSKSLTDMIAGESARAKANGSAEQRRRFDELLFLRSAWLKDVQGENSSGGPTIS